VSNSAPSASGGETSLHGEYSPPPHSRAPPSAPNRPKCLVPLDTYSSQHAPLPRHDPDQTIQGQVGSSGAGRCIALTVKQSGSTGVDLSRGRRPTRHGSETKGTLGCRLSPRRCPSYSLRLSVSPSHEIVLSSSRDLGNSPSVIPVDSQQLLHFLHRLL
jgi:hypothetical protein